MLEPRGVNAQGGVATANLGRVSLADGGAPFIRIDGLTNKVECDTAPALQARGGRGAGGRYDGIEEAVRAYHDTRYQGIEQ